MRRLLAIGFIWGCCAVAWLILGSTIVHRSGGTSNAMAEEVRLLWGPAIVQTPPSARYQPVVARPASEPEPQPHGVNGDANDVETPPDAAPSAEAPNQQAAKTPLPVIPVQGSDIDVDLALEHRRKGLMWFATYAVDFKGRYTFRNTTDLEREITMRFPLASGSTVYDAFKVVDADGKPVDATVAAGEAVWTRVMGAGERVDYTVVYKSRGTSSWTYGSEGATAKVKDFALRLTVNDPRVDFPVGTISPSQHTVDGGVWKGTWAFDSLVSSAPIGVELPHRLNPGVVASRITFFAPVSLLFFFFVVAIIAAARRKNIHPMNYFMFGCAFFAFHLLFAYLVDHLPLMASFVTSALVSLALVVSYTRLFVGWRFALSVVGVAQLLYLVLFSFTFFWQGFTGLSITVGAVLTLFVIMQITGRIDWGDAARVLRNKDEPPPPEPPPAYGPQPFTPQPIGGE